MRTEQGSRPASENIARLAYDLNSVALALAAEAAQVACWGAPGVGIAGRIEEFAARLATMIDDVGASRDMLKRTRLSGASAARRGAPPVWALS